MNNPRLLSLCSGIGGIDLAATWANFEIAGQVEIDAYCRAILAKHWPDVPRMADIHDVQGDEFGPIDLIAGGIPCQPFSVAGKRQGEADHRHLWPAMRRIIERARPAWVLIENVAHFVNMALDGIYTDLEAQGYEVRAYLFPAMAIGAPHRRDRVFVVAYSESVDASLSGKAKSERNQRHPWVEFGCSYCRQCIEQPCQAMANADRQGLAVGQSIRSNICQELTPTQRGGSERSALRPTERRVRGMAHGIPQGLDGATHWCDEWPGVPRVITGQLHRRDRLRALGNAVVPQQVYPILTAIHEAMHCYFINPS